MRAGACSSRSRAGTSPSPLGVYSFVPAPPVVTRQNTTARPSRVQRATVPAIAHSMSSGCAAMQRIVRNAAESSWGFRAVGMREECTRGARSRRKARAARSGYRGGESGGVPAGGGGIIGADDGGGGGGGGG